MAGRSGHAARFCADFRRRGGGRPPSGVASGAASGGDHRPEMGSGGLCRQGAAAAGSHDPSGSVCGSLPAGVVCALRREFGVCGGVRPGSDAHAAGIRIPPGASGAEQRGAGSEPAGSAPRLYPPPDRSPWLVICRAGQRRGSGGSAGRIPAPAPGRQHPAGSAQGGQG